MALLPKNVSTDHRQTVTRLNNNNYFVKSRKGSKTLPKISKPVIAQNKKLFCSVYGRQSDGRYN